MRQRTTNPHRRASKPTRAFTLVEVSLATVIGGFVLLAAISLIMTLERTNRTMQRRASEAEQMEHTRRVLSRTFASLLMAAPNQNRQATARANTATANAAANQKQAANDAQNSTRSGATGGTNNIALAGSVARNIASATGSASRAAEQDGASGSLPDEPPPPEVPPRILLHVDEAVSPVQMQQKTLEGSTIVFAPQRLEVVLLDSPVPTRQPDPFVIAKFVQREARRRGVSHSTANDAREQDSSATDAQADEAEPGEEDSQDWGVRAVRGALELHPAVDRAGKVLVNAEGMPESWELWWMPQLPVHSIEEIREMGRGQAALEAASLGTPFRIAKDIASLRYRVFDDRQKKDDFEAVTANQLPAYVEVDIAMKHGGAASWLFEVSWATGAETRPPEPPTPTDASGAPNQNATQNGSQATGVQLHINNAAPTPTSTNKPGQRRGSIIPQQSRSGGGTK